jgi:hypothetical protein
MVRVPEADWLTDTVWLSDDDELGCDRDVLPVAAVADTVPRLEELVAVGEYGQRSHRKRASSAAVALKSRRDPGPANTSLKLNPALGPSGIGAKKEQLTTDRVPSKMSTVGSLTMSAARVRSVVMAESRICSAICAF